MKFEPNDKSSAMRRLLFAGVSFMILLVAVYGSSLDCSWQFDDFQNIVENQKIQVKEWSWDAILKIIQEQHARTMFRPLAYLGFAVNHSIGRLDPFNKWRLNIKTVGWYICVLRGDAVIRRRRESMRCQRRDLCGG